MKLYLAPHHDDLLLSVPQHLLWDQSRGVRRAAVVLFSRESEEMTRICNDLHHQLELPVHCLGFEEAVVRGASLRACLRTRRTLGEVADDPLLPALVHRLSELFAQLEVALVVAPLLAVHLDHALTRGAAEAACEVGGEDLLVYYEDLPYGALWPQAATQAKDGLTSLLPPPRADGARLDSLFEALLPLVPQRDLDRTRRHLEVSGERLWSRPSTRNQTPPIIHGCG